MLRGPSSAAEIGASRHSRKSRHQTPKTARTHRRPLRARPPSPVPDAESGNTMATGPDLASGEAEHADAARNRLVLMSLPSSCSVSGPCTMSCSSAALAAMYPSTRWATPAARGASPDPGVVEPRVGDIPPAALSPSFSSWASLLPGRDRLPPGCSGDHAVDNNVDGEAEPRVAIAGDHLRGVGGDQREPVGR